VGEGGDVFYNPLGFMAHISEPVIWCLFLFLAVVAELRHFMRLRLRVKYLDASSAPTALVPTDRPTIYQANFFKTNES
jgi:hypothetical protein